MLGLLNCFNKASALQSKVMQLARCENHLSSEDFARTSSLISIDIEEINKCLIDTFGAEDNDVNSIIHSLTECASGLNIKLNARIDDLNID